MKLNQTSNLHMIEHSLTDYTILATDCVEKIKLLEPVQDLPSTVVGMGAIPASNLSGCSPLYI